MELENSVEETTHNDLATQRAKVLGDIINISLNETERKIIDSFIKSPSLSSIHPYLIQILNEGKIGTKDVDKISDFVIDWSIDNENSPLPQPLQFIQAVLLPKLSNQDIALPEMPSSPQQSQMSRGHEPQYDALVVDEENLPTYLPKIHNIIELEVRRRVKIEMKAHAELKKSYDELKKRFADITKMLSSH